MGCACVYPKQQGDYITFPTRGAKSEREDNPLSKGAIKIQSSFRSMKTRSQLKSERENFINKYNDQLNNDINISKITNEELNNKISPSAKKAKINFEESKNQLISDNKINKIDIFDEISNQNSILSFQTSPLIYKDKNEIFEGTIKYDPINNQYSKYGKGTIITSNGDIINCQYPNNPLTKYMISNIFYSNGDIFIGTTSTDKTKDNLRNGTIFFNTEKNGFDDFAKIDIKPDNKGLINRIYINGDVYEGEGLLTKNHQVIPEGKGKMIYHETKIVYEGEFKNGKYDGKGTLFEPDKENFNNPTDGTYTNANWVNGVTQGHGIIKVKSNTGTITTKCLFRFGKIIQSFTKVVNQKIILHKKVWEFLNSLELYLFCKELKTKSLLEYFKSNCEILWKIKFAKMIYLSLNTKEENPLNLKINAKLIGYYFKSYQQLLKNFSSKLITFLPIVGIMTTGGIVETRFLYNNIFNPDISKVYTTHYLFHCNKDVEICGVLNQNFINDNSDDINDNNGNQIDSGLKSNTFSELEFLKAHHDEFISKPKDFIEKYNSFEHNYHPVDKFRTKIDDKKFIVNEKIIGPNFDKALFSIHYFTVHIPKQSEIYTILNSPCHFLAIYLHDYLDNEASFEIDNEKISEYKFNLKNLYLKNRNDNIPTLSYTENSNFSLLEYDSSKWTTNKKLICILEIKKYDENQIPYLIQLNKYYHIGRYVTVKLINQQLLFGNKQMNCIDFGTINFFGEVYYL